MNEYPKYYIQGLDNIVFDSRDDVILVAHFLGMDFEYNPIEGYSKNIYIKYSEWSESEDLGVVTYDDVASFQWDNKDYKIFEKYNKLYKLL